MDLNKPIELPWAAKRKAPVTFTPTPPRVNLVPPAVPERAAMARAKRYAILQAVAAFVLIAAIAGYTWLHAAGVRVELGLATAAQANATKELALYSPVTNLAAQTSALTATVNEQTRGEVLHGDIYARFVSDVGSVGTVTNLSMTTGADASGCATTDPFTKVALAGCVSFTVDSSQGSAGAAQLISQLSADNWFVGAFIPSLGQGSDGTTALTGTVGVSQLSAQSASPTGTGAVPGSSPTSAATPAPSPTTTEGTAK